jgi:hypothetical protein
MNVGIEPAGTLQFLGFENQNIRCPEQNFCRADN